MKHAIRQLSQAPSIAAYQPCAVDTFMSPAGILQLNANAYGLSHLTVVGSDRTEIALAKVSEDVLNQAKAHISETQVQLARYFAGERFEFNLKLAPKGTEFQREVWQALLMLERCTSSNNVLNLLPKPNSKTAPANTYCKSHKASAISTMLLSLMASCNSLSSSAINSTLNWHLSFVGMVACSKTGCLKVL